MWKSLEYHPTEFDIDSHGSVGTSRWMLPYADLLTLLLGLFLVFMAAATHPNTPAVKRITPQSIQTENTLSTNAHIPDKTLAMQLKDQLKTVLPLQGIDVHSQSRGLIISMKDSILFAPGQADLSPHAQQTLDRLLDRLNVVLNPDQSKMHLSKKEIGLVSNRSISIEGHTDDVPINTALYPSNWELSTARATRIVRYLIEHHHIPPEQLAAVGYGEFKPLDNNSSIEGKQKNRRVDIVVLRD